RGREVEDPRGEPVPDQRVDDMGADEPGSAGYEDVRAFSRGHGANVSGPAARRVPVTFLSGRIGSAERFSRVRKFSCTTWVVCGALRSASSRPIADGPAATDAAGHDRS